MAGEVWHGLSCNRRQANGKRYGMQAARTWKQAGIIGRHETTRGDG